MHEVWRNDLQCDVQGHPRRTEVFEVLCLKTEVNRPGLASNISVLPTSPMAYLYTGTSFGFREHRTMAVAKSKEA